jgi:hypothetical protein
MELSFHCKVLTACPARRIYTTSLRRSLRILRLYTWQNQNEVEIAVLNFPETWFHSESLTLVSIWKDASITMDNLISETLLHYNRYLNEWISYLKILIFMTLCQLNNVVIWASDLKTAQCSIQISYRVIRPISRNKTPLIMVPKMVPHIFRSDIACIFKKLHKSAWTSAASSFRYAACSSSADKTDKKRNLEMLR